MKCDICGQNVGDSYDGAKVSHAACAMEASPPRQWDDRQNGRHKQDYREACDMRAKQVVAGNYFVFWVRG